MDQICVISPVFFFNTRLLVVFAAVFWFVRFFRRLFLSGTWLVCVGDLSPVFGACEPRFAFQALGGGGWWITTIVGLLRFQGTSHAPPPVVVAPLLTLAVRDCLVLFVVVLVCVYSLVSMCVFIIHKYLLDLSVDLVARSALLSY
jgi:hypothetical protein